MMAKLSIRCLYKRDHLLNVSLDNRVSALSESRRHLILCLYMFSDLASAVSEPRQFFVACEDCAARLALSLPRRLDNRVSSSPVLSEARRIFLRYLSLRMLRFYARVVVELELRYVQRPLYIYKIAARCTTRRMHGIIGERERSNCVVDMRCI